MMRRAPLSWPYPALKQTGLDEPWFGLVDEGSKLNLNTATAAMLEALPRMTPQLAAAIIDWRDTDSTVSDNGAFLQR